MLKEKLYLFLDTVSDDKDIINLFQMVRVSQANGMKLYDPMLHTLQAQPFCLFRIG